MFSLNGKSLNGVKFLERNGRMYGALKDYGVNTEYEMREVKLCKPIDAVMMDLDGTTLTSEEFWIYIIEETVKEILGDSNFSLEEEDIPFVSGFTTFRHLEYCIEKYAQGRDLSDAVARYHRIVERELEKIERGEGNVAAFRPTEGLKEFLLELKRRGIRIGLATSGLDYKALPEIHAVFRNLKLGDPLKFYDAIIMGGRRKGAGEYGTIGEVAAKPHPWVYTELAYVGLGIKEPSHVFGIEDSAAGVLALRFAGFSAIGLASGNIAKSGLDCLCCKKAKNLSEILELL